MNDNQNDQQHAIRTMKPAEKHKKVLARGVSLTKTGHGLNEHDDKKNGIDDLE